MSVRRSLIEVPGNIPRMLQKARAFPVDVLMLDLEDSVPAEDEAKEEARTHLKKEMSEGTFAARELVVRTNSPGSRWFLRDATLAAELGFATVVIPKAYGVDDIVLAAGVLRNCYRGEGPDLIIIVETPGMLLDLGRLARLDMRVSGLITGGFDYTLETGSLALMPDSGEMDDSHLTLNRQLVLASARRLKCSALDVPLVRNPKDLVQVRRAATRSRHLGFDGCALYYPPHVEVVNEVFSPSPEELSWAVRVEEGYAESLAVGRAALMIDGQAILPQHRKLASGLLKRSRELDSQ